VTLLDVTGLVKSYGDRTVVRDVSYHVNEGEIVGLLGPNGAGKTTTFRMTVGMIRPDKGRVILGGKDITNLPMYKRARLGMGYLSQEPSIFRHMSVRDNLLAVLEARGINSKTRLSRTDELIEGFGLGHVARAGATTLSGGERRRLELARTLALEPQLVLLDEPFSGVDPIAVEEIQQHLHTLRDEGIAVLITDHAVRETLGTTDRAYIIYEGSIFQHGDAKTLADDPQVRKIYLGETFSMNFSTPTESLAEKETPPPEASTPAPLPRPEAPTPAPPTPVESLLPPGELPPLDDEAPPSKSKAPKKAASAKKASSAKAKTKKAAGRKASARKVSPKKAAKAAPKKSSRSRKSPEDKTGS